MMKVIFLFMSLFVLLFACNTSTDRQDENGMFLIVLRIPRPPGPQRGGFRAVFEDVEKAEEINHHPGAAGEQ